jgi:hypothetical protein
MFITQLLHNSSNFLLRSIIEYLKLTCRKINLIVNQKE